MLLILSIIRLTINSNVGYECRNRADNSQINSDSFINSKKKKSGFRWIFKFRNLKLNSEWKLSNRNSEKENRFLSNEITNISILKLIIIIFEFILFDFLFYLLRSATSDRFNIGSFRKWQKASDKCAWDPKPTTWKKYQWLSKKCFAAAGFEPMSINKCSKN